MALTLETNARNALADALDALINTGGAGSLVFETSGDVAVATFALNATAFGAAVAGVITLAGVPLQDASAAGGTIEHFSIYNGAAAKVLEGSMGTSGADINITSLTIVATEAVDLTALTITMPATP